MDAIVIEQKLRELTKVEGFIRHEDLSEILRLSGELYTKSVIECVVAPLIKRIEVLEQELDTHERDRA